MTLSPGERIPIASAPNLRDLGGWPTRDGGQVRQGLLYRSGELDKLNEEDGAALAALKIRTIYDLRTEAERTPQPDQVPAGIEYVVLDVLADSAGAGPAQLLAVLSDPKAAEEMLGGGKALALFEHAYREIVNLPSALAAYQRFFSDIAQAEHRPALFHCTTGKDRTGWAAAAMLTLLGVVDDDVPQDYLVTNTELLPFAQAIMDQFKSIGGDPELLRPVLTVQEEYLNAALDEMRSLFGSVEGYFQDGLDLDVDTQTRMRTVFIESA